MQRNCDKQRKPQRTQRPRRKVAAQKVKDAFKETFLYIKHHSRAVLLVIGIGACIALLFGRG